MAGKHWNTRNLTQATIPGLVPPGLIIMWSGAQAPPGWALCNGLNGTPDLRDRFIVGAGGKYTVGATGGVETHQHSHSLSGTTSGASGGYNVVSPFINELAASRGHTHAYSGQSAVATIDNRPPWYSLAYIQKLNYTAPVAGTHYNVENLDETNGLLPLGAILAWSGAIGSIPSGWKLCDGANGTPNLRDRFVVASGGKYPIGNTGGSQNAPHTHTVSITTGRDSAANHVGLLNITAVGYPNHTHTLGGNLNQASPDNRPPYYALAFIMRG